MTEALIFPIPVLTPIIGRPTNSTLQVLQQQLYQNARAIPCDLGGGVDGHLGLIMTPGTYLTRPNAIRFVVPDSPGLLAAPPNDVNMLVVAEHKRVYNNNIKVFQKYQSVRNALIQQIMRVPTVSVSASLSTVTPAPLRVDPIPQSYDVLTNRRHRRRTARQKPEQAQGPTYT